MTAPTPNEWDDSTDMPAPCQPIGCDNGYHLSGCFYEVAAGVTPTFNPAYQVARCGDWSTHGPHVVDSGPDQPRNCPGTGGAA